MYKLTEREFKALKRPVFPEIQFKSAGDSFQIQSLIPILNKDNEEYYSPLPLLGYNINSITLLEEFVDSYNKEACRISDMLVEELTEEESEKLYKITKDGN